MSIDPAGGNPQAQSSQPLTVVQKEALAKLHDVATQFEGVFLEMLMNAMQDTVPQNTIFGQESSAEQTWQSMLNDERSQAIAKNGGLGLAQQLENQLRNKVLSDAGQEADVDVDKRIDP
ncbi:MAG TPA: rod-binding protein [Candidatus Acidoferrales bacterium]|nr:rod-binding protein [Candidatus Acidoferrales bacterium]HTX56529.1 rod-binding protein [Candidatus Acidoferrales bacterium]